MSRFLEHITRSKMFRDFKLAWLFQKLQGMCGMWKEGELAAGESVIKSAPWLGVLKRKKSSPEIWFYINIFNLFIICITKYHFIITQMSIGRAAAIFLRSGLLDMLFICVTKITRNSYLVHIINIFMICILTSWQPLI